MIFSTREKLPPSIVLPSAWPRRVLTLLCLGLLGSGLVCVQSAAPVANDDASRYHDRTFRVARVVDGDTLDIDVPDGDKQVTRIRLWGVDTPEVAGRGKPDMHFGPEASAFAKTTLEGKSVHVVLSPDRTRGLYGRLLAYVFLERGGRMFNEMLLEEGYAYADLRFAHTYKKRFETLDKRARRARVGLWANISLEKMPSWKQRFENRD